MEREQLEKASKEAFDDFYAFDPISDYQFQLIFEKGARWAMSQSLADKLSDSEKEMIKAIYTRKVYGAENVEKKFTEECLLEAIFGTEFLKS